MKNMYQTSWLCLLLGCILFAACSKDDVNDALAPKITLSSSTSIYTGKVNRDIVLEATVEHGDGGIYSWKQDGKIICTQPVCIFRSDKTGEYYVTLRVDTKNGYAEKEMRVDVLEMAPPVISLAVPEGGIVTYVNTELTLSPDVQNSEGATYQWYIDNEKAGTDKDQVFTKTETGDYQVKLVATNEDGTTEYETIVRVEESPTLRIETTDPVSHIKSAPRTVMEGRSVFLKPIIVNAVDPTYSWSVDVIEPEGVTTPYFNFTPAEQKEYTVKLTVTNHTPQVRSVLSRNLTQSESNTASATIQVNCVGTDNEMNRFRPYAGTERFTVMEFVAAPGQFVNAGYEATTYEEANAYAQKRLNEGNYVSLGGFGGYLTVYCSHSIVSSNGDYDFCVFGNPFDGSSEPGIVYVMQDENGDGLPNDTWYEVKGSETGKPETIQDYAITYYRSEKSAIRWSDNQGNNGSMGFINHGTSSMYPKWIRPNSYTLRGTRLEPRTVQEGGIWKNKSFDWGYVDNYSTTDLITTKNPMTQQTATGNRIRISDAVTPDGQPANLKYIDFIKVHTALNVSAGALGENSTEVFGYASLDPEAAIQ